MGIYLLYILYVASMDPKAGECRYNQYRSVGIYLLYILYVASMDPKAGECRYNQYRSVGIYLLYIYYMWLVWTQKEENVDIISIGQVSGDIPVIYTICG